MAVNKITSTETKRRNNLIIRNRLNKGKKYVETLKNVNDPKHRVIKKCIFCGIESKIWNRGKVSEFCNTKCKMDYMKVNNPIRYKALTLFGCIPLGKNKLEIAFNFLNKYLGSLCKYCDTILTLDNVSLDHKIPISWRTIKRTKNPLFNDVKNLQIICRKCNQLKRNLNDEQFTKLLYFLNTDLDMKKKIMDRLSASVIIFRKKY